MMELNNTVEHHEHITYEEMKRLFVITSEEPSYADLDYIQSIDEKVESCDVCRRRYRFFVNFRVAFKSSASEPQTLAEKVNLYFQELLKQTDQLLRDKLSAWLEGPQSFIGDLNQLRLSPAGASGTRDLESGEQTLTPELSAEGNIGFFNFELQSTVKLNISIKQKPGDDQPICVVIFGRDKTNFTAAYPLETYGKEHLRAKTDALPIGQYVLCVPAMFTLE